MVLTPDPDQGNREQLAEIRDRSGIDRAFEPEETHTPEDTKAFNPSVVARENPTYWLLLAMAAVAFFSLVGIAFLTVQMHEVNQALRQLKEASDSAGKSARDSETTARSIESMIKSQAIRQEAAAESSKPGSRIAIKKSRARK